MRHETGLRGARIETLVELLVMFGLFAALVLVLEAARPAMIGAADELGTLLRLGLGCLGRPDWAC